MPRTDEISLDPTPSILIVGDSGSHKTHFLGTLPSPFIFDFDKGLSILRGVAGVEYATFKDAPYKSKSFNPEIGIYEYGKAYPAFLEKLNEVGAPIKTKSTGKADVEKPNPYKAIGLDSMTMLANCCMNYVRKEAGVGDAAPTLPQYNSQISLLRTLMDQLTSWDILKIVTAHIQRDNNKVMETTEMLPLVTGRLAGELAIYFDEVYYTKTEGKGPQRKFTFITESEGLIKQAKTRYGVPTGSLVDWKAIAPYITGEKTQYA